MGRIGGCGWGWFVGGRGRLLGRCTGLRRGWTTVFELVAGALSSDPAKSKAAALELHIAEERAYGSFAEMAAAEAKGRTGLTRSRSSRPSRSFSAGENVFGGGDSRDLRQAVDYDGGRCGGAGGYGSAQRADFGLTHNYTGYPLVRQAREMIEAGELGRFRVVQVEYAQDWLDHGGVAPDTNRRLAH